MIQVVRVLVLDWSFKANVSNEAGCGMTVVPPPPLQMRGYTRRCRLRGGGLQALLASAVLLTLGSLATLASAGSYGGSRNMDFVRAYGTKFLAGSNSFYFQGMCARLGVCARVGRRAHSNWA